MNSGNHLVTAIALCAISLLSPASARGQRRAIDIEKSTMTVHVYKAGVFSALGHNHEIVAPIARGTVDPAAHQVELYVKSGTLKVRDPEVSEKDRAEIQSTMLGPDVLDAQNQPEIAFRSTQADSAGAGAWKLSGNLTVRGQSHMVNVEVQEKNGRYVGTSRFKQTEFGITPVKVAGGAIRVKDEILVEFDIQLAQP